ncbi:uncharacterized protein VNE69_09121 [Vairimorpha necatrix]|uniref:Uncharacterized protein n=1 Tax=Vairimorpha necatrix TaxID=6039 RepID=A0AAX4JF04_9MICR
MKESLRRLRMMRRTRNQYRIEVRTDVLSRTACIDAVLELQSLP